MIVIADTTPLNDLILIDLAPILSELFGQDEIRGRREASRRGFNITGTVGLLDRAGARGLSDVPTTVARGRQTNFRVSPQLLNTLLDRYKS